MEHNSSPKDAEMFGDFMETGKGELDSFYPYIGEVLPFRTDLALDKI